MHISVVHVFRFYGSQSLRKNGVQMQTVETKRDTIAHDRRSRAAEKNERRIRNDIQYSSLCTQNTVRL